MYALIRHNGDDFHRTNLEVDVCISRDLGVCVCVCVCGGGGGYMYVSIITYAAIMYTLLEGRHSIDNNIAVLEVHFIPGRKHTPVSLNLFSQQSFKFKMSIISQVIIQIAKCTG